MHRCNVEDLEEKGSSDATMDCLTCVKLLKIQATPTGTVPFFCLSPHRTINAASIGL